MKKTILFMLFGIFCSYWFFPEKGKSNFSYSRTCKYKPGNRIL